MKKIYQKISHQYKKDLSGKHSHLLSREKGFCFHNNRGFHKRPVKGVIVKLEKYLLVLTTHNFIFFTRYFKLVHNKSNIFSHFKKLIKIPYVRAGGLNNVFEPSLNISMCVCVCVCVCVRACVCECVCVCCMVYLPKRKSCSLH